MPRTSRIVIVDAAHHVMQRGNSGDDVFVTDEDREVFLAYLREATEHVGLIVEGYCLMSDHVHLVVTPEEETSLGSALKRTNQRYAQYVNRVHGRRGHLWQDRFFSCPLDDAHYWKALAYVERTPVRARLCRKPWRYVWSSAAAHCGGPDGSGLLDLDLWSEQIDPDDWQDEVAQRCDEADVEQLRLCTSRGRPWAGEAFIRKWEASLGRRLRALPPGRPKKSEHG